MKKEEIKKEIQPRKTGKVKASHRFIVALAIVSILGFLGIFVESIFGIVLTDYVEASWLIVLGIGLILEARIKRLKNIKQEGLTPVYFNSIITAVIGLFAIVTGILSLPQITINSPIFQSIKGMVAIIAIIIIIIQTWIIE